MTNAASFCHNKTTRPTNSGPLKGVIREQREWDEYKKGAERPGQQNRREQEEYKKGSGRMKKGAGRQDPS